MKTKTTWTMRADVVGRPFYDFQSQGFVAIGRHSLKDLSGLKTREVGREFASAGLRARLRFSFGPIHFKPASEDRQLQKRASVDAALERERSDPDLTLIGCVKAKRSGLTSQKTSTYFRFLCKIG